MSFNTFHSVAPSVNIYSGCSVKKSWVFFQETLMLKIIFCWNSFFNQGTFIKSKYIEKSELCIKILKQNIMIG